LSNRPIGQKAFIGYFGSEDQDTWRENDATELLKSYKGKLDVLIDVGTGDKFYKLGQLLPENFDETAEYLQIRGPHYKVRFQEVSTLKKFVDLGLTLWISIDRSMIIATILSRVL